MKFIQTEEQIKKDFGFSVKDGIFWVLMNSIALTFLVPYVISLGANPLQVGLLQSLPIFLASFLVLISYRILRLFKSKKNSIVVFVTLQALMWIPLAVAHFFFSNSLTIWVTIAIYVLIIGFGTIVHPVYMDWIRKLFPVKKMGAYLARKHIILEMISIIPIIITGYVLDLIKSSDTLIGFTIIFACAGLFRFISGRYLNKMNVTEDKKGIRIETKKRIKPVLKIFKKEVLNDKPFLKFLIFVILFYFGLYIGTIYVSYFLLDTLSYTYTMYVWWKIAFIAGTLLSLGYWGYISDKYGSIKILKNSVLFMPLFILTIAIFYRSYLIIVISSFLAGVVFAGFNLSITNYFYQNVKSDLINHSSFFLIIQAIAILLGTLFGALIIGVARNFFGNELEAIILVFIISAIFRFFAYLYGRNIKDLNRRNIHLFKSIIIQKPVIYGLKGFGIYLSQEEKKMLSKAKENKMKLKEFTKKEEEIIKNKMKKEKEEIMSLINKVKNEEKKIMTRFKTKKVTTSIKLKTKKKK